MSRRHQSKGRWEEGDRVVFSTFDHELTQFSELDGIEGVVVYQENDYSVAVDVPTYGRIVCDPYDLLTA